MYLIECFHGMSMIVAVCTERSPLRLTSTIIGLTSTIIGLTRIGIGYVGLMCRLIFHSKGHGVGKTSIRGGIKTNLSLLLLLGN